MPNMVKESDTSAALLARDKILREPSIQECQSESENSKHYENLQTLMWAQFGSNLKQD